MGPFCSHNRQILHPPGWWYTSAVAKKKINPSDKLTASQIEIVGQFKDYSHESPKLTFEQVVRKTFGPKLFRAHRTGENSRRNAAQSSIKNGKRRSKGN
jgi:hypothetical protein